MGDIFFLKTLRGLFQKVANCTPYIIVLFEFAHCYVENSRVMVEYRICNN